VRQLQLSPATSSAVRVSKTWGSLLAYLGLIGLADA
jgi:hypothetical protein